MKVCIRSPLVLWWPHDAKLMESPPSNSSNPPVIMNDGHYRMLRTRNGDGIPATVILWFRIASTLWHFCLFMREWGSERPTPGIWRRTENGQRRWNSGATGFGSAGEKRSIIHCKRIMKRGQPFYCRWVKKQIKIRVTSSHEWQISKDLIWLLNKQS